MKTSQLYFYLILTVLIFSCRNYEKKEESRKYLSVEESININKKILNKYSNIIKTEIAKRQWKMTCTKTGLWYEIYKKGKGKKASLGKYASISYHKELLDGINLNDNDSIDIAKFLIGKSGFESGIEEGILYLHEGDKARFILPPHLAYGATGNGGKISGFAIIVYDLELISISDN